VTLSIIFHEIPQELGDFGVLLYAGFKKTKALLYNYIVAALTMFGVVIGFLLINWIEGLNMALVPIAAGGFIYIAATDLIPELQKVIKLKHSILTFFIFILALILMLALKMISE